MNRIITIAAGLALALTLNAAPQIGRGTPPGSAIGEPWPITTAQGCRIVYGLMETRNGVSTITFGWYDDRIKVCYLHEQEAARNLANWWPKLLGQYRAEMVWIIIQPGQSIPAQVGGNPAGSY